MKKKLLAFTAVLGALWLIADAFGLRDALSPEGIRELAVGAGCVGVLPLAMSRVRFRDYFVGSAIGLAAPVAVWVFLSDAVLSCSGGLG